VCKGCGTLLCYQVVAGVNAVDLQLPCYRAGSLSPAAPVAFRSQAVAGDKFACAGIYLSRSLPTGVACTLCSAAVAVWWRGAVMVGCDLCTCSIAGAIHSFSFWVVVCVAFSFAWLPQVSVPGLGG
jgi:hypothetical protein